jgi:hypothetical protein
VRFNNRLSGCESNNTCVFLLKAIDKNPLEALVVEAKTHSFGTQI